MEQVGRNVTDCEEGILKEKRYLIHDRDPLYTTQFLGILAESGIEPVKLPPRSPNLNAFAERFVRSIKEECLERMLLFGENSLRTAVREYLAHYHAERNHQGLGNRLIVPTTENKRTAEQFKGNKGSRWHPQLLPPRRRITAVRRLLSLPSIEWRHVLELCPPLGNHPPQITVRPPLTSAPGGQCHLGPLFSASATSFEFLDHKRALIESRE